MTPVKAQAATVDEIRPLLKLCRFGRLYEVQDWIAAGKPVNLPAQRTPNSSLRSPLEVAIKCGFHSLVQTLLQGGASGSHELHTPLHIALRKRRLDLIKLLVEHGLDPASVSMGQAFATGDMELMEYFIGRGADVETGNPLAYALCRRVRPVLRVFKQYRDRFPSFQEQANIALRHHCVRGSDKWIALMLWAGADPYAPGADRHNKRLGAGDPGIAALGLAALHKRFWVFDSKYVQLDVKHPAMRSVVNWVCDSREVKTLKKLLDLGYAPNDLESGGSSTVQYLLIGLEGGLWWNTPLLRDRAYDSKECREWVERLQLLLERGARWVPEGKTEMNAIRRGLRKMTPRGVAEFVRVMASHRPCDKQHLEDLLRPASIQTHLKKHKSKITKALASWK